ncbi:MAG: T9SS type A sorting domain-containing protein, partial [Candidatus Azobacteroides sp.]|nr:T9SS type A sorting domain-containing protein [Candidatus Azobacteroides sp.]
ILCLHIPPTNYPQTLPWALSGLVNITVNNQLYSNCIVTNSILTAVSGGYPTPANFFTCKLSGGGDTWLLLEDNSGKIRAFNDDGGTTSDGYSWGNASRIKTYLTNISAGYVFSYSSNNPVLECDLYMGLAPLPSSFKLLSDFPNLKTNSSFVSDTVTTALPGQSGYYVCYDWSVGQKSYSGYPNIGEDRFLRNWDYYYAAYGYIPLSVGENTENAAIAIWGSFKDSENVVFSHAMIRKNSKDPGQPHGFEWESKMSNYQRIMHTKEALSGGNWGNIIRYYKPDPNRTVSSVIPAPESVFSASDLNKIAALKNQIPVAVLSGFEERYHLWEKTWSRPELSVYNNPFRYAESSEYENLLEYCMKYGKVIWPLLFEKLTPKDIFVINLLKDITCSDKRNFFDDIKPVRKKDELFPSTHSVLVDYCKGLLVKEEANIQNAIRNISIAEKGNLEVNISVNGREILLNLSSIIGDKASVTIYNVFGGLEYEISYNLSKGNQILAINTSKLKKGIYIVQITIGGESLSQTIGI